MTIPCCKQCCSLPDSTYMLAQVCIHQLSCSANNLPKFQPPNVSSGCDYFTTNTASTGTEAPNSNFLSFNPYQGQQFNEQLAASGANLGAPQGWKSQTAAKLEALQETQQWLEQKRQTKVDRQWVVTRLAQAQSMILMAAALDTPTILMLITQPLLLRTLCYWQLKWPPRIKTIMRYLS
jgi:hypothetical protein